MVALLDAISARSIPDLTGLLSEQDRAIPFLPAIELCTPGSRELSQRRQFHYFVREIAYAFQRRLAGESTG